MKKRLLALFLAFVMAMSLLPVSVFADGGTGGQMQGTKDNPITANSNGVTVNKYVSPDEDGQYNLTLEAYASNQLTTTTTTTPLDIVLVLDVSGSMKDNIGDGSYVAAEDPTVNTTWSFSDVENFGSGRTLYYEKDGIYHRVKGDSQWHLLKPTDNYCLQYRDGWGWTTFTDKVDDPDQGIYEGTLYVYQSSETKLAAMKTAVNGFIDTVAQAPASEGAPHRIGIVTFSSQANEIAGLTDVKAEATDLKNQVNGLYANGATAVDYALNKAENTLQDARANAKKVVVLFTDGEPNHYSGFDREVAADAINTARDLKNEKTTVYTIGMFEDADPSDTSGDFNKYMNAVSSRFPEATATGSNDYEHRNLTVNWGTDAEKQYYFAAADADELEQVFSDIADEVTTGTLTANPDAGAILSDSLSQYVKFPEGITPERVTVQFAEAKSYSEKDGFTFNDPGALPVGVAPTVEVKGNTITITGFDYKGNAASYNKTDKTVSGGKLVVTFPIEINENACNEDTNIADGYYPTNSKAELSYKGSKDSVKNDASTELTESPKVSYTKPGFTVTWKNWDESPLETDYDVIYGTKPSYDGNEPTKPADDKYTYTFAGWATQAGQEIGVAEENLDKVTGEVTYYAAFSKTEITRYSITINYQDNEGNELKTPHSESQKVGFEYSFDVSSDTTGTIPFIIDKGETQYVFNQIKSGSSPLEGTVAGAVNITAEYLLDSDKDGTPDAYEATVTYKVVNGTWSDGSTTDKTEKFNLKKFNHTTNAWESANPTLGSTIPTGMKPNATHIAEGASWSDSITADTAATTPSAL